MNEIVRVWAGLDAWRAESALIEFVGDGVRATGTQIGTDPFPYRADYRLDAAEHFVTRSFEVTATGSGWSRWIRLRQHGGGHWEVASEHSGESGMAPPGAEASSLEGALDPDLAFSPLTNLLPVRRHDLHLQNGSADFLMAWVSLPDLSVKPSAQRYEHVRREGRGSVVRYLDRGLFAGFTVDLTLDEYGLVTLYPGLARAVGRPE